jgi:hypothetical protein
MVAVVVAAVDMPGTLVQVVALEDKRKLVDLVDLVDLVESDEIHLVVGKEVEDRSKLIAVNTHRRVEAD